MTETVVTTTFMPVSPSDVFSILRTASTDLHMPLSETDGHLQLQTPLGTVQAIGERAGVRVTLGSADAGLLQSLQDRIDSYIDHAHPGVARNWSSARPGALPANLTIATVVGVERLSPAFFRVRVAAPDIERLTRDGLHFRLLIEPDGYKGRWPAIGADGRTEWPGGGEAWRRPVYTVRAFDLSALTLDFDVFVYEGAGSRPGAGRWSQARRSD